MIELVHQMAILADVELNYKQQMLEGNWKEFFDENNVGIPLSTLVTLEVADLPEAFEKKFYAESLIKQTFINFCKELNLNYKNNFTTAGKMFEMSENPLISEKEIEAL